MQNLIKSLEIEGYMVVADDSNCQIDTAKDNQPTLKSDIVDYASAYLG